MPKKQQFFILVIALRLKMSTFKEEWMNVCEWRCCWCCNLRPNDWLAKHWYGLLTKYLFLIVYNRSFAVSGLYRRFISAQKQQGFDPEALQVWPAFADHCILNESQFCNSTQTPDSFSWFSFFPKVQLAVNDVEQNLPMSKFEPGSSDFGSDHAVNCTTCFKCMEEFTKPFKRCIVGVQSKRNK